MSKYLSSQAALSDLGSKLKTYRIYRGLTQEDLAEKTGVSRRSIQYMENGRDINLTTLIKVLMAFGLDSNLELLVPDSNRRPSFFVKNKGVIPQRARASKQTKQTVKKAFKWGDEQ